MAMFLSNLRSAWRQLTRSPVVSLVAVVSLALGIGANTTVFTLVNALLLNPMPVHDISRVVVIGTTEMRDGAQQFLGGTSRLNFVDLRDQQSVFSGAVVTGFTPLSLSGNGEPEQLAAQIVSGNYFDVLGPPLAAGRTFIPDEDRELGAHPVVVLSHSLWTRRFGADPAIVGKALTLNGHNFTVIGVTGEGFRGTFPIGGPDMWVPFAMYREVLTGLGAEGYNSRRGLIYQAFARLKDGVSLEQAQANVDGIGRGLAESSRPTIAAARLRCGRSARACFRPPSSSSWCSRGVSAWRWSPWCCSSPAATSPTCSWRERARDGRRSRCGCRSAPAEVV